MNWKQYFFWNDWSLFQFSQHNLLSFVCIMCNTVFTGCNCPEFANFRFFIAVSCFSNPLLVGLFLSVDATVEVSVFVLFCLPSDFLLFETEERDEWLAECASWLELNPEWKPPFSLSCVDTTSYTYPRKIISEDVDTTTQILGGTFPRMLISLQGGIQP